MSAVLVVRHPVSDYAAWRTVYDEVEPIRAAHGCTGKLVAVSPTDHNDVFITHEFPSADQAKAFSEDPEFHAAMQRAGVAGQPSLEILDVV